MKTFNFLQCDVGDMVYFELSDIFRECYLCHGHMPARSVESTQTASIEFRENFGREATEQEMKHAICDTCYEKAIAFAQEKGITLRDT